VQLSGFMMEVVETAYAGHAKVLASTVDLKKFPDGNIYFISFIASFHSFPPFNVLSSLLFSGIVCVGGDGIVNEVS
jgi:diacylglycerol kinase family enzyme